MWHANFHVVGQFGVTYLLRIIIQWNGSNTFQVSIMMLHVTYSCIYCVVPFCPMSIYVLFNCVLQKVLAAHGATKVSAYVTHAVFPNQSYERFMTANSGNWRFSLSPVFQLFKLWFAHCFNFMAAGPGDQFAYFWITDSCPQTVKAISQPSIWGVQPC